MPRDTWDNIQKAYLVISVTASAAYLLMQTGQPSPAMALIKGCAVGPLAFLALRARAWRRDAGLLALGLGFSTAGDVLLDLDPRFFVFGLSAFLATHITYACLFVRNRTAAAGRDAKALAAVSGIVAFSVTLSTWIVPSVGALAVPVVLYICAVTVMVSTAVLAHFAERWVAVGAVLFLISDALLAIHKFKTPVPWRDFLVWTTYYLAQLGIALGYLRSATPSAHKTQHA